MIAEALFYNTGYLFYYTGLLILYCLMILVFLILVGWASDMILNIKRVTIGYIFYCVYSKNMTNTKFSIFRKNNIYTIEVKENKK